MLITIALIVAGTLGTFAAGRKAQSHLAARREAQERALEPGAFHRLCDESRIAVGELLSNDVKGDWVGGQLSLGGLTYTSTHSLPNGRLVAAKLNSGGCRYCGLRLHVLFEIAEKTDGKGTFVRPLCSICPSLKCGMIERNGSYTHSARYGRLIEEAENVHSLLLELLDRRRNAPYDLLTEASPTLALTAGDKTS